MIKKNIENLLLALLSGLLLAFLFPGFYLYFLAWIALVPLLIAILRTDEIKLVVLEGLLCGFLFFLINLSWITTLVEFGGFWVYLGWIGLAFLQALFIIVFALVVKRFNNNPLITAMSWALIEWLRSLGVFGISAGGLGYSQATFLPLLQIAAYTQVFGIGFVIVLANAALANLILRQDRKNYVIFAGTLVFVLMLIIVGSLALRSRPEGRSLKLALIQPNIDQRTRMNSQAVPFVFETNLSLSQQSLMDGPQVVVWPETALFVYLLRSWHYLDELRTFLDKAQVPLITGMPDYTGNEVYNSILSFSPKGELLGRYEKQRLVAFGEYLPFRPLTYPFLKSTGFFGSEFSPGRRTDTIPLLNYKVGALVCFESTFPLLSRRHSRQGADFILNLTNDAWFKNSSVLEQHFQQGILRAVENRKYFIQVANTGISGVVDPYGRVVKRTRANERTYLTVEIFLP